MPGPAKPARNTTRPWWLPRIGNQALRYRRRISCLAAVWGSKGHCVESGAMRLPRDRWMWNQWQSNSVVIELRCTSELLGGGPWRPRPAVRRGAHDQMVVAAHTAKAKARARAATFAGVGKRHGDSKRRARAT